MAAIRGSAMSAVFIDAPPKTRNRYIREALNRESARRPGANRADGHVSEGLRSRGNAERPCPGLWAGARSGAAGRSGVRAGLGGGLREHFGGGGGPAQVPEPQTG